MLAEAIVRKAIGLLEALLKVVGVQHRVFADRTQPRIAELQEISIGLKHYPEVPIEGVNAADRSGTVPIEAEYFLLLHDPRQRQELDQLLCHSNGACTGSAAAMWGGQGLMQVEMEDVCPHVPGPRPAKKGVQVCSVEVTKPARPMHHLRHVEDLLLKDPQGIGNGEHDRRDGFIEGLLEGGEVDHPIFTGRNLGDGKAGKGRRSRIRAVCRIRKKDPLAAVLAAVLKVALHEKHSG